MDDRIGNLEFLSDKTKKDIDLFVINSFLSEDEDSKRKFYELIQRVAIESIFSSNKNLKNK